MSAIPLPVCRWRREPTGAGRHYCVSPKLVVGRTGVPDEGCASCRYRDHAPLARPPGPCLHLGPRIGTVPCPPCESRVGHPVLVPLHQCAVYGSCTIAAEIAGTACCHGCPKKESGWRRPGVGSVRHLTYHVYPRGETWRWNLAQLVPRLPLFNGRRIVSVATDATTASADDVLQVLGEQDIHMIRVDNDPRAREALTHLPMIAELETHHGNADVTFYGHAKGITTWPLYPGTRPWTEEMYRACLDYWPLVRRLLAEHAAVGPYRRIGPGLPHELVSWHFSGSFRWTRNADLYSRNWRNIGNEWCAGEGYPARQFALTETACIHGEFGSGGLGLYLQQTWDQWATEEATRFHQEHVGDRQTPHCVTVILTSHRQPALVHQAIESVLHSDTDAWHLLIADSGPALRAGAFARYASDGRVSVMDTEETPDMALAENLQSRAINQCWARGRVRGDLVLHLSDDDVLDPHWLSRVIQAAQEHPEQGAWYGWARRARLREDGTEEPLRPLRCVGIGRPGNTLRCRVDGMQVAHRRTARTEWPRALHLAEHADGWWMDTLSTRAAIHPLDACVGTHRHTPLSTFTQ